MKTIGIFRIALSLTIALAATLNGQGFNFDKYIEKKDATLNEAVDDKLAYVLEKTKNIIEKAGTEIRRADQLLIVSSKIELGDLLGQVDNANSEAFLGALYEYRNILVSVEKLLRAKNSVSDFHVSVCNKLNEFLKAWDEQYQKMSYNSLDIEKEWLHLVRMASADFDIQLEQFRTLNDQLEEAINEYKYTFGQSAFLKNDQREEISTLAKIF